MPAVRKWTRLIALLCIGGLLPSLVHAQTIVWTDSSARTIQRRAVSGGPVSTITTFSVTQVAQHIHYDFVERKLYYLFDNGPESVFQRCDLDGSNPEDIPTPSLGNPALNIAHRKLYWSNSGVIYRSELNGSGVQSYSFGANGVFAMEPVGDVLFLATGGGLPKALWRADADGSNAQFLHNTGAPFDLAYDPIEDKLYAGVLNEVVRINADGTNYQVVVPPATDDVEHVEVDVRGRKLYWVKTSSKVIRRSNLDGANAEDFVTAADVGNPNFTPEGLTIVDSPPIPAVSDWGMVVTVLLILGFGVVILKKRTAVESQSAGS